MDDVITLVSYTREQDNYGVWRETAASERELFCQLGSITRQEFFEAGRSGLNPSFVFTIFKGDYNGETVCQYQGKQYAIYRTYPIPNSDYLELYVERKGGTNG